MSDYPETAPPATAVARLSLSLRVSGVPVLVGTAMLASRLIWEQTVWTWERGPQMVGFSLAHGPGAILFVFPLLLLIWTAIIIALTVLNMVRRKTVEPTRWAWLGVAVLLLAVMELPEGFWRELSLVSWQLRDALATYSFMQPIVATSVRSGRSYPTVLPLMRLTMLIGGQPCTQRR